MKNSLLLVFLICSPGITSVFASDVTVKKAFQLTSGNYIVLYVETDNQANIDAFIDELKSYPNKITSAKYNYYTHEFTIEFTDLMRNDTIYQILLKYFNDFKEIDGHYPN